MSGRLPAPGSREEHGEEEDEEWTHLEQPLDRAGAKRQENCTEVLVNDDDGVEGEGARQ